MHLHADCHINLVNLHDWLRMILISSRPCAKERRKRHQGEEVRVYVIIEMDKIMTMQSNTPDYVQRRRVFTIGDKSACLP